MREKILKQTIRKRLKIFFDNFKNQEIYYCKINNFEPFITTSYTKFFNYICNEHLSDILLNKNREIKEK